MKLTPRHIRILELYCGDAVASTHEELAKMAGVSRATIQRVLREPEAKRIIRDLTDERQALARSAILDKINRQALAGCTASQKLACQINRDIGSGGSTQVVNVTQNTEEAADSIKRLWADRELVTTTEDEG
jgi:DNA-binding transcriptional regulator YhcF (GntR family)